jgi:hypothetical protein
MTNPLRMSFGKKLRSIQEKGSGKPTIGCAMRVRSGTTKGYTEYTRVWG